MTEDDRDSGLRERVERLERQVEELRRELARSAKASGTGPGGSRAWAFGDRRASATDSTPSHGTGRRDSATGSRQATGRLARIPPGDVWARRGESWLGRVGVAFVVLALAFLLKYSFDRGWITPWLRVIFGLQVGLLLLIVGLHLEERRRLYGQILLGGAVAILYLVGFASFQLYGLVSFAAAFSYMATVTVLALVLAERQRQASLATLGALGGLATPFLLDTGSGNVPALVLYSILVLLWSSALQIRRGWRSLLVVIGLGGLSVMAMAAAGSEAGVRWITTVGVFVAWALSGVSPLVRDVLRTTDPDRWPGAPLGWPAGTLGLERDAVDRWVARLFSVGASVAGVALIAATWGLEWRTGARWLMGVALVFAALSWLGRRAPSTRHVGAEAAAVLLALGTWGGFSLSWAFPLLAVEATALHHLRRRWALEGLGFLGHMVFAGLALVFAGRSAELLGGAGHAPLRVAAFGQLLAVGLAFGVSSVLPGKDAPRTYRLGAHVAFLLWLAVELSPFPDGTGLVSIGWGAYGIALLGLALRGGGRGFQFAGLSTLGLVAAKMLLVDMAQLGVIWRILLFLGFGGAFLGLSYLINRAEGDVVDDVHGPEGAAAKADADTQADVALDAGSGSARQATDEESQSRKGGGVDGV